MNTHWVSDDDRSDKQRRWWRRPAVITAVAVLVAALLITGGVVLGRDSHSTVAAVSSPTPVASSPPAAATSAPSAAVAPSGTATARATSAPADACPVGLVSDVLPASAPADVVWRATPMAPVPYSKTWGPYRITSTGLPRCFSHSPTGAVIAVRQIDAWLFSSQWKTVLATQVARTPGYTELQSALASEPPAGAQETDAVVGFNIAEYTRAAATVDLVVEGTNGGVDACPLAVQWTEGDWQLTPRPDGTLTEETCRAAAAGTYIPWGPDE